jgi:hypothetical protein
MTKYAGEQDLTFAGKTMTVHETIDFEDYSLQELKERLDTLIALYGPHGKIRKIVQPIPYGEGDTTTEYRIELPA